MRCMDCGQCGSLIDGRLANCPYCDARRSLVQRGGGYLPGSQSVATHAVAARSGLSTFLNFRWKKQGASDPVVQGQPPSARP
jgi:DNA-directed RNA polymerase subunit RPC12/RpoP